MSIWSGAPSTGEGAALGVVEAGACCTIQDSGRRLYLRQGVASAGPMDWIGFAQAQRLAGIAPIDALARLPGIEISVGGMVLEAVGGAVRLGLAGGEFAVALDGRSLRVPASIELAPGSRLSIKAGLTGAWFYVVPSPALAAGKVMGSHATHVRYQLGPNGGQMLKRGDLLALVTGAPLRGAQVHTLAPARRHGAIRVVLGPQHGYFDSDALHDFLAGAFSVSLRSDRMAYFLEGPRVFPHSSYDIVSDATVLGSIQVAGDGSPCVLLADRPPTGGYPKIATVIRADIGRLAQARPGERIRFEAVGIDAAVAALVAVRDWLDGAAMEPRPFAIDLAALARGDDPMGVWSTVTGAPDLVAASEA